LAPAVVTLRVVFELTQPEERVLGCLLEKQRTTPDVYPMTLNALRLACNQSTNRDPVVDYSEDFVHDTLQSLHAKQLTRVATGHGNRATKYRHLLEDELGVSDDEAAVICVLLLRGAQTPGELKSRTERMHAFADLSDLDDTLEALTRRGLVELFERRPGEKQVRYRHLFGAVAGDGETAEHAEPAPAGDLAEQLTALRGEVAALRAEVAALRERVVQPDADAN
jgi:uncharacterized protein YceH (UPF0502 family)